MDWRRLAMGVALGAGLGASPLRGQGPTTQPAGAATRPAQVATRPVQPATQPVVPLATQPAQIAATGEPELTEGAVSARLKEIEGKKDLDPAMRDAIVGLYNQALADLKRAVEYGAKAAEYDKAAVEAPLQTQRLKEASTQPTSRPAYEVPVGIAMDELATRLRKLELDLADLRKNADTLSEAAKSRVARQAELPKAITDARDELRSVRDRLDALKASTDAPDTRLAKQYQLLARRKALEAQTAALEKELATFETRGALLRAQQEYYVREVSQLQTAIAAWQDALAKRREAEARRQLEEAQRKQREAAGKHALVQEIARYNTYLTSLRTGPEGLNERRKRTAVVQETVKASLKRIDDASEKARRMVGEVAVTDAIGLFLRTQRQQLPDVDALRRRSEDRQARMSRLRLQQLELSEKAAEISDVDARAKYLVENAAPPVPEAYRQDVLAAVRDGLVDTRTYLEALIRDDEEYFNELVRVDTDEQHLIRQAGKFRAYIDERVLWIRSTSPLQVWPLKGGDLARAADAVMWFVDFGSWRRLAATAWANAVDHPVRPMFGLLVIVALLAGRRRLRGSLRKVGQSVTVNYPGKLRQTLWAVILTFLRAVTYPGVVWIVGRLLSSGGDEESFAFAIGRGLMLAAAVWLPAAFVREAGREVGLARAHFRWPVQTVEAVWRPLNRLLPIGLPLVFVVGTLAVQPVEAHSNSLGRIAAIAGLAMLGAYAAAVLRPRGAIAQTLARHHQASYLHRLRWLLYPLTVALPLWLAAQAAMGYYYTAVQLSWRLLIQSWALIGLALFQAVLMRWFAIVRARLADQRPKWQWPDTEQPGDESPEPAAEPRDNHSAPTMAEVDAQTRRFLQFAMAVLAVLSVWLIWAGVLPALGMLREVRLWSVTGPEGPVAVTLADLVAAIGVLLLTVVVTRNIPGILEITVLQRLHVEPGSRYAANALARYFVGAIGIVLAASALGVNWPHVQWLLAALSLGLGFGLQEIVANFVSGLILLFERPIRVGDVVTVGGMTGTVSRIRIRATTITDWDRKELLVPNKEFITGQLVNWTLSDNVIRVVVPVGIAYGSDTELARKLLLEVARKHPRVLSDPEPAAFFLGFGDNSLNFELRTFVGSLADFVPVRHDLHMAIDREFRQAGIEIAFPQRDIHIRSIQAALPVSRARASWDSLRK